MTTIHKRLLAGSFDLLLIGFVSKTIQNFIFTPGYFVIFSLYFLIFIAYHSTPGGIVLGIKSSFSGKNKNTNYVKLFLKASLQILLLLVLGSILLEAENYPMSSMQSIFALTFINVLPAFFSKKELMIHDIISGSFVEIDNSSNKNQKTLIYILFLSLMLLIIFF